MKDIRILVVEDEMLVAHQLNKKLQKLGYLVSPAVSSGEDALQSLRQFHTNLVLMDIVIKGDIDGIEVADRVQREFKVPVIFLTAYADEETLQRAELTRAYAYLVKPVQERELNAMIRVVLNRHARDQEMLDTIAAVEELGYAIGSTANRLSKQVTGSHLVTMEDDLAFALERQQFELHYQPMVSLKTGGIIGAEALIRWNHPGHGMIGPLSFIPKIEETGMIHEIGDWVLETACHQLKHWSDMISGPLNMSINLSSKQVKPNVLQTKIVELLSECQLDPSHLELELTESIIINNLPEQIAVLRALKETGIKLSLDDFGTGYSGLSYLQNFPFDILKIDRQFVRNIRSNNKFTAIILAIINLADTLDMQTITEGVENKEEIEFLKKNNCDIVQGYFFSPPVDADSFTQLLLSGKVFST